MFPDRSQARIVLIVDDVPDNLSVLHDALDESTMAIHVDEAGGAARAVWKTPLARDLMQRYFGAEANGPLPPAMHDWLRSEAPVAAQGREPRTLALEKDERQLVLALQQR